MAYTVGLSLEQLNRSRILRAIIHDHVGYPAKSIKFAPEIHRHKLITYNDFALSYSIVKNKRLPDPYPTRCSNYNGLRQDVCNADCLNMITVTHLQKYPFTRIIPEKLDIDFNYSFGHINSNDLLNRTLRDMFRSFELECAAKCFRPDCNDTIKVTFNHAINVRNDSLSFRVDLPRGSNFYITFTPTMVLIDYVTLMLSCFGTWLGVSVYSFNPVNLIKLIRRRRSARKAECNNAKFSFIFTQLAITNNRLEQLQMLMLNRERRKR